MKDIDIIVLLTRSGTYVLAVAVFAIVMMLRRFIETAAPSLKKKADENAPEPTYATSMARWWNQVILFNMPVAVGGLFGLFIQSEFFFGDIAERSVRMTLGGVIGWFSSFLYNLLRRAIKQKMGLDISPSDPALDSISPPRGT